MALAYCFKVLNETSDVELTHYAAYLAKHPPQYEALIHEPSAWSCAHGVGRWSENCGCVIDQPTLENKNGVRFKTRRF